MNKAYLLPILSPLALIWMVDTAPATALSATQIAQIAKQSTVQIESANSPGSGVIIQKTNDTYTVLTAAHVVKNRSAAYKILTVDGVDQVVKNIRTFSNQVDLAVVEFTSSKAYKVPKLAKDSNEAIEGSTVYVSGFPTTATIDRAIFNFTEGKVTANSSRPLQDGYSLVYSNNTLPGHSGGPVWNEQGEVIAIHGKGDVDTKLSTSNINPNIRIKTGFNLGIAINTFTQAAAALGIPRLRPAVAIATKPTPVDDFLVSGLDKMKRGQYAQAITDFDRAIQTNPQRSVAYRYRGTAKSLDLSDRALQDAAAVARARQAAIANPQLDFSVQLKRQFLADYQLALVDFDRARQLQPRDHWALEGAGNIYNNLGEYTTALRVMNQSIQIKPTDNAYSIRGFAKWQTGDLGGALADYGAAIQRSPESDFYYGMRAGVYRSQGNYTQAIQDYNQALKLDPQNANHYTNRGLAKSNQGDLNGAIADLSQAIKLNSNPVLNQTLYVARGNLYVNKLAHREAIVDFTTALQIDPRDTTSLYFRANSYAALQQYTPAFADVATALRLDPNYIDALLLQGVFYLDTNQAAAAMQSLNQALRLAGNNPSKQYVLSIALANRGGAKYLLKDYAGALQDLNQALTLDRDLPRAFYYRGLLNADQGRTAEAIQDLEVAAQLFLKYKKPDKYQVITAKLQELKQRRRPVTGIRNY